MITNDIICGGAEVLKVIKFVWELLKVLLILIPIILILMIMLDLVKNIISSKEDEMKKNQSLIFKRLLMTAALFLVLPIVQFTVGLLGNLGVDFMECINIAATETDFSQYEITFPEISNTTDVNLGSSSGTIIASDSLSSLENASSYKQITVLDTITAKDLTKKVAVVGKNGCETAQSFCVVENYFVTAQINSDDTKTLIQVYDKKTGENKNSVMSDFHHANGMTYNKNTSSIYVVHNLKNEYSVFSDKNLETTKSLNPTAKNFPKSISGMAYDATTNQYYASKGSNVYIYDTDLNLIRTVKKIRTGIPQDIGAYKGIILVIVFLQNNSTANNAIDLYRASDGAYLGTYNVQFPNMELESIDYYGTGNTFSLYFNSSGKKEDYIYNTNKIDLK